VEVAPNPNPNPGPGPALAEIAEQPVGDLMTGRPIRVPTWFTAAAALRVGRLKRASHLMILDRGQLVGAVSTRVLAGAPGHEPVARWMTPSRLCLTPRTPRAQALDLMITRGLECLPVVSGALLVGMVARADLG
jgi:CBS domain-containing protein